MALEGNFALFCNPAEDVRMAVHGDDFVCLSDDEGFKHIEKTSHVQIFNERHGNT